MIASIKKALHSFIKSNKVYPTVFALASGLYPMLYIYFKNFSIVNSIDHLLFFILSFILVPVAVFNVVHWVLRKANKSNYSLFAMTLLNVFTFLFLIKTIIYSGLQRKKTVLIILIALLFAYFLRRYLKHLVVIQYILAGIGLLTLIPVIYSNLSIETSWQKQPDTILETTFKKTPNVYVIQPDGYVNFSELERGYYNYDNSQFQDYLSDKGFVTYADYRSNYPTTLSSNASFFMMKHHYYNNRISNFELYNARDMIVSENPVLEIFKNNGYHTNFITQTGYMLFNRPKMGYDYCNFEYNDFPFISPGIADPIDIRDDLKKVISSTKNQPKFLFVEMLKPWHIKSRAQNSEKKTIEREQWLKSLNEANDLLKYTIDLIKKHDDNALIIIAADHGAYVGFDYSHEADAMTTDRDLIYSIFSSQLSIYWPKNETPKFNDKFKTTVNLFRLLFTYLSENETYLEHLQPDISYKVLREKVDIGIYQYINDEGRIELKPYK